MSTVSVSAAQPVSSLDQILSLPWLDRTTAIIACVPVVYLLQHRLQHWHLGIPLITYVLMTLLLIATMIVRRPPVRVTPNPLYWLLAFVATYWSVLTLSLFQPGKPVDAQWITDGLAILGFLITIWARLSLGRNIGFVPAQRQLVSTGAYAFMRHPIYTGGLFLNTAFVLRAYSPRNALLLALGIFWFIPVKSLVEESFSPTRLAVRRLHETSARPLDSVRNLKVQFAACAGRAEVKLK